MQMNGLIQRYMDEETIRIFCFFLKIKFNPRDSCCLHCTRYKLCEHDAVKLLQVYGYIPWLEEDVNDLIEKVYGHQKCRDCIL